MLRLLPVLMLMACGISLENFPDRAAEASCKKAEDCGDLVGTYDDCVNNISGAVQTAVGLASAFGGEYDPAAAASCVSDIRSADCGDDLDAGACDVFPSE